MSQKQGRPFKLTFTNATGERVTEAPRLIISVDGKEKALVVDEAHRLASVPYDDADERLWAMARARAQDMMSVPGH